MDEKNKTPQHEAPQANEPYEPPAVVSEEIFETLAIACGKTGGPQCLGNGGINS